MYFFITATCMYVYGMGYIMCRFIGYGIQAAKSGNGYRNQRATLGQGGIWEVYFRVAKYS